MNQFIAPTMRDVAQRCGLSESTVSHVINGTKKVSAKSRSLVEQAMEDLKYHLDAHARRLARGHSDFFGLIISDIENPFFPSVIKAFETCAINDGMDVLLCATNYDRARTERAFRKMIENKSPAVAVMTSRVQPELGSLLAEHGVAAVFLDSNTTAPFKSNISLNYRRGAMEAVHYLYNLGHRKFALIAGPQDRPSHVAYREAVQAAMIDVGLDLRVIVAKNDIGSGAAAVHTLMTDRSLPTAVLCSNDLTAMSVVRTLSKCGLQVPSDVSVVGVDDIPIAALTEPPLTTIRIPREHLGIAAYKTLQRMLADTNRAGFESVLDTELIIRESTGQNLSSTTA